MVASSARLRTLLNVSVSQVLLHYLELEGVRKVFGVPGVGDHGRPVPAAQAA